MSDMEDEIMLSSPLALHSDDTGFVWGVWELWTENICNAVTKASKRPEDSSLQTSSLIAAKWVTATALLLCWVGESPTEKQKVK
jgi:hypothetical protein